MSFIQKLIERKIQATGSLASQHVVDDDLAAQQSEVTSHEDAVSVVDIVDLDDPDSPVALAPPVQEDDQIAGSEASQSERSDNVLSLTDPFILDEADEIDVDISDLPDLPDLDAEDAAEADQGLAAVSDFDDDVEIDESEDISLDDEAFNIWDVDVDDVADKPEAKSATPQPDQPEPAEIAATPEPQMPKVQAIEPVNQDSKPKTSEPAPDVAAEVTAEVTAEVAAEVAAEVTTEVAPEAADTKAEEPAASVPTPAPANPEPEEAKSAPQAAPKAPEKRRVGRVKTRLLGFEHTSKPGVNLFEPSAVAEAADETTAEQAAQPRFPVGWLVVIDGPGRGASFALHAGMSQIGRGEDQAVSLDFGDATISRNNHAAIVYDVETHTFLMGHGGKANVVRLNSKPLICTEEVKNTDLIRIGETTLRLVVFCTAEFNWEGQNSKGPDDVAIA